jgi:hypothetical protein
MNRLRPAFCAWLLMCAAFVPGGLGAAAAAVDPVQWAGAVRRSQGLGGVPGDTLLSRAAELHAQELAAAGRISHRGADGSDALTRYLRAGGTDARVGEIIGAGARLEDVEAAWLSSPSHRGVILGPHWTHAGWGAARAGASMVWVVLFCQRRVTGLAVVREDGRVRVSGVLTVGDAAAPVLLAGATRVAPELWSPAEGRFSFVAGAEEASGYLRLGYRSAAGALVITNVLTSPRGREPRGAADRFSGTEEPPAQE